MKLFHALGLVAAATASSFRAVSAEGCFDDSSPFHSNDWNYCQEISDTIFMYYTPREDTIMLGLHATEGVTGWSSLSPAGNGGMKGASQIVVRKDDNSGEWVAEDRYSMDYTMPSMDDSQDVQLIFAQQDEDTGETAWGVVIPQNSCDEPYDYAIEDKRIFMIWAVGSDHSFGYHGVNRGQFTANLGGPPTEPVNLDAYKFVDLRMPNVSMVRGETDADPTNPFICSYFDMEVLGEEIGFTSEDKIQMVGHNPLLTKGNEEFVHHLALFTCEGSTALSAGGQQPFDDSNLNHHLVEPACTNMPPGCTDLIALWAVGADALSLPEDVGFPLGEGHRWLVMQMHYYNPKMVQGVYDSSGLRVHLTKELRPIDAGIMPLNAGAATGQQKPIPGGMQDVAMETLYVEPECTQAWTEPINVIGVNHHSHFLGTYQEIVVERDGVNLGPMRKEYHFDYNHQSSVQPVRALQQLLPGDRIAATCHFDTAEVEGEVQIGEESNKEMCFPNLMYYPKQAMSRFIYYDIQAASKFWIDDIEWCMLPSADDKFESLCEESLFTDVASFYKTFLARLPIQVPSFSYSNFCNGGQLSSGLINRLNGRLAVVGTSICPEDCVASQSCSEEVLLDQAKEVCKATCEHFGPSLYPDTSRTELYSASNVFCTKPFFDAPTLAEPAACAVKGTLPQTIKLTEQSGPGVKEPVQSPSPVPETSSGGAGAMCNLFAAMIVMVFSSFLM